jgi:thymidylate kinase
VTYSLLMKLAKIIVCEGADKCGKETQSKMLLSTLSIHGIETDIAEVPVRDGLTHPMIYRMLKSGSCIEYPNIFQFLQFINKMLFQLFILPWKRLKNDVVILDRWGLSSLVYGDVSGANWTLNTIYWMLLVKPTLTIILSGPPRSDQQDDAYEIDTRMQRKVRDHYIAWALAHPHDHVVIQNGGTRQEVQDRICSVLKTRNII